jgi:tRNA G37 N-methylase TrmD
MHYVIGEEIDVGDHVLLGGHPATVVVVIGRAEYDPESIAENWSDHEGGFLMRTDDGQLYMYEYADEDIQLISRGASAHDVHR